MKISFVKSLPIDSLKVQERRVTCSVALAGSVTIRVPIRIKIKMYHPSLQVSNRRNSNNKTARYAVENYLLYS